MQDYSSTEILEMDKQTFCENFSNPEFGLPLGKEIASKHGYYEPLKRIPEGSSLVFKIGSDYFLKLTPPFYSGSIEAEINATKIIGNQLPLSIPHIVIEDQIRNWKYVITKNVRGLQAKHVFKSLSAENLKTFALDIGKTIKAIHNIKSDGFEREFGPWKTYLENNLKNQETIHLSRGNSKEWSLKINEFVLKQKENLLKLGPEKLIHADLNHEHLMMEEVNNEWRITGILDFADSMNAPIELEFILPIVCFFKGKPELQRLVLEGAEYGLKYSSRDYSNLMMALTLQNRFIAFHDWFDIEIRNGAESVEEIASTVFIL
jgi:hygromycin-B 7''-O-kinase